MLAFLGISLFAWAIIAGVGTAVYTVAAQQRQSKLSRAAAARRAAEAKVEAAKQRKWQEGQLQAELQAGEYFEELRAEQMELQAQASNINTLAGLIESQGKQGTRTEFFTLPPAKTYDPLTKLNIAIDGLFKRN